MFRVLKLLSIHQFKQQFCQLFVKGFYKSPMGVLIFCCCSSNLGVVFFKQLCHFVFRFLPIIALKRLWVRKHTYLFIDGFQHKCSLA